MSILINFYSFYDVPLKIYDHILIKFILKIQLIQVVLYFGLPFTNSESKTKI